MKLLEALERAKIHELLLMAVQTSVGIGFIKFAVEVMPREETRTEVVVERCLRDF